MGPTERPTSPMQPMDSVPTRATRRSGLETTGLLLGVLGTALLINQHLLRFAADTDLWRGLRSPELVAWERSQFASTWPLELLYVAAASLALLLGPRAVARVVGQEGRAGEPVSAWLGAFWIACGVAAGTAALLALTSGGRAAGGTALLFPGPGLALLWGLFVVMAGWGGRRSPLIRRDWTVYAYAVALLPLSTLPAVPLWAGVARLDLDAALTTAVTMAFPAHLLVAHFVIFEVLERRARTSRAP